MYLVVTEFNFWILLYSYAQTMAAHFCVKYRLHDGVGLETFVLTYVGILTNVYMLSLDAAPLFPKKYKVLAVVLLMVIQCYWVIYFLFFFGHDVNWDTAVCQHSQCFSPRSLALSGMTTSILFLIKMLYRCGFCQYLMLIQVPIASSIANNVFDVHF